jgi:hypothetical protein
MIAYWERDSEWMGEGLVGAWCPSFTGATGLQLADISGQANHGVLTNMDGTDWVASGGKLALDFDGVNDYVNCGRVPALENATALSFSLWSKWAVNSSFQAGFFSYSAVGQFANDIFFLYLPYGAYGLQINNGADGNRQLSGSPSGNWDHFAWTYGNSSVSFFINGIQQTLSGAYSYPSSTSGGSASHQLWIGGYNAFASSWGLNGQTDDFRIYNRVLTPSEIRLLYTGGRGAGMLREPPRRRSFQGVTIPRPSSNPVRRKPRKNNTLLNGLVGAWCPSLGANGTRLLDVSGRNNHGVLTNMDANTDYIPSGGKLALDFDGVNDYVNVPIQFSDNKATFSCWINMRSYVAYRPLGLFGRTPVTFSPSIGMQSGIDGNRLGYVWNNNDVNTYNWNQGPIIPLNEWVLIALTVFPDGATVYLGSQSRRLTKVTNAMSHLLQTVSSGFRISGDTYLDRSCDCQLDDVRIYNRALTNREINQLCIGGRGYGLKQQRIKVGFTDPSPNLNKISIRKPKKKNTLTTGLVGAWCPSLGATGTRLRDVSGRNNDGVLTNMDPNTDWITSGGKLALDFDGSNDVVTFNQISLGSVHTTAAWVYPRLPVPFTFHGLCGDGSSNNCSLAATGVSPSITQIAYSWAGTAVSVTVPNFVNVWTHIAAVRINNQVEFFYNGISYGTVTGSSIPSFSPNRIGQRNLGVNTNGMIDDFRFYNRALSPQEINQLYVGGRGYGLTPQRSRTTKKTIYVDAPVPAKPKPAVDTSKLKQGLVGAWIPSLGPTGRRLEDRSPYKNHGTLISMDPNTDWVTSGGLGALDFDGVDDQITSTVPIPSASITFSAWIYIRTLDSTFRYICGVQNSGLDGGRMLRINSSNQMQFEIIGSSIKDVNGVTLTTNKWIHIVGIKNDSESSAYLYQDGNQVGSVSLTGVTYSAVLSNFKIAARPDANSNYFNGQLDDIRIYNRALTAQEVRALYLGGRGYGFRPQRNNRYTFGALPLRRFSSRYLCYPG